GLWRPPRPRQRPHPVLPGRGRAGRRHPRRSAEEVRDAGLRRRPAALVGGPPVRLFVACEPGAAVTEAAATLIADLRPRVSRLAPHARVSWVPAERLHFTVRF